MCPQAVQGSFCTPQGKAVLSLSDEDDYDYDDGDEDDDVSAQPNCLPWCALIRDDPPLTHRSKLASNHQLSVLSAVRGLLGSPLAVLL